MFLIFSCNNQFDCDHDLATEDTGTFSNNVQSFGTLRTSLHNFEITSSISFKMPGKKTNLQNKTFFLIYLSIQVKGTLDLEVKGTETLIKLFTLYRKTIYLNEIPLVASKYQLRKELKAFTPVFVKFYLWS